jgi:hypothetical protein
VLPVLLEKRNRFGPDTMSDKRYYVKLKWAAAGVVEGLTSI